MFNTKYKIKILAAGINPKKGEVIILLIITYGYCTHSHAAIDKNYLFLILLK